MTSRRHRAGLLLAAFAVVVSTCTTRTEPPARSPTTTAPTAPSAPSPDATATASSAPVPAPVEPTRTAPPRAPNVVVVTMDDMRWDELRFAPQARRSIARRGITFHNSFAPFPLCCPSRASFLTGQYAHNHGVLHHLDPYGFGSFRDDRSIGTRLQRAGYRTALIGKYLNGYGRQPSKVTGGPSATYVPRGWTDWMVGLDNSGGSGGSTYDYFDYTENVNGVVTRTTGRYSSTVIADHAIDLIDEYAASTRPFFLWINPVAPHHGRPAEPDDPPTETGGTGTHQTPARPAWVEGRFDEVLRRAPGVPAAGHDPEPTLDDKPRFMRLSPPLRPADKAAILEVARQRAEAIYAWDSDFGRIITQLRRTGELDRTVLVFTSDNGYLLGEHRFMSDKVLPHEPSLRVPLLVAGPGIQRGQRYAPATTLDLTATVLDLAGAQRDAEADGESLRPVLTGSDATWRRPVLTEGYFPELPRLVEDFPALTEVGLRTGRYKFIRWASGQRELYDLGRDPHELRSLHRSPAYSRLLARMERLWQQYVDCRAASCRVPLPTDLWESPAALARIDANFATQREVYFGDADRSGSG